MLDTSSYAMVLKKSTQSYDKKKLSCVLITKKNIDFFPLTFVVEAGADQAEGSMAGQCRTQTLCCRSP